MRFFYLFLLLFLGVSTMAQEIISGIQINPAVRAKSIELTKLKMQPYLEDIPPLTMPFFDDFSENSIYPSPNRWVDRFAFVNTDYPLFPIDLGVVTLDAINDSGYIYPDAIPGPTTFIADHLTSRYIRMDSVFTPVSRALQPSDSIYLSFYYQPEGRGMKPSPTDSLVLQFLLSPAFDSITPTDTTSIPERWITVWTSPGMALDTFYLINNVYFKRVMIPIVDSGKFFKKYFSFRFFNYVSLASSSQPSWQSNTDIWNLDDIYLNLGRTRNDTIRREIRFIDRAPSLLKNYESMPYPQYCNNPTNEMADSVYILLTNRDTVLHYGTYKYFVNQSGGSFTTSYSNDTVKLNSFYKYGLNSQRPQIPFLFPILGSDSASFQVMHTIKNNEAAPIYADTIIGYQNFYNYFAYDDGTPEAGYGLKGTGAMLAYKFNLNKSPDTLRAIRIFFNRTLSDANQQFFLLTVWNDNNGNPGDTIYSRVEYVRLPDTLDMFTTFLLEVPVRISGTFYIGTIQTTDDNLNIGFDMYDDAHDKILYNADGEWLTSSYPGALLMRPVIGKPLPVGIAETQKQDNLLRIYPNPNNTGKLTVCLSETTGQKNHPASMITIRNMVGQLVLSTDFKESIILPDLPAGIYVLSVGNLTNGTTHNSKLIITR
ncbi:MAG: T9SS type A sorting domain-containing protein [Bacteroidetes bacterium]|nr:T9SS type A sorting domain-containing protein [Bacteroidota bacterium]